MEKIPRWKIWLSYLLELHVESAESDYNPYLYVSLRRGRYQLSTANAVYSYGDLYTNFARTFARWNWEQYPVDEVLILGLGLGSIPVILEQTHGQLCQITAVEIDEVVVDLAERYVLGELQNPQQMIVADAAIVVQQLPDESYDLLCVDIFDDDLVPEVFETITFLENVKALLRPGGVLLFNRLAANPKDEQLSKQFFEDTFLKVFPEGYCLDVGGNYMLVSNKEAVFES
ncbi:spermidine synthase [Lewinella cohaerens]|uniref:spermidine synthase n=1 Tax=Lewinella cohaerens TaxID=70995 RepID=UPI00037A2D29|nr:fused MFS/spermidine synthase [Lewinella cohaerens]